MIYIKYENLNIKELEFIGKGIHGKVYKIDSEKCIKIFKKNEFWQKELITLQMAQGNYHFPVIFEWGKKYIIREYVDGIELDKYLKESGLTMELSLKIINLYDAMKKVGFLRLDTVLFHIFLTKDMNLKLIDTARAMDKTISCPKLLLKDLKSLKLKNEFLNHVKELRYDLYLSWINSN